jgi:hypothetical protein
MISEVLSILFIQWFLMLDMPPALLLLLRFSFLAIIQFFFEFRRAFFHNDSVSWKRFSLFEYVQNI